MAHLGATNRNPHRPHLPRIEAAVALRGVPAPTARSAAAHLLALSAAAVALVDPMTVTDEAAVGIPIAVAFSMLRVTSSRRRLAASTLAMDAVGMTLFLAATGAPGSAYLFLALAGAWWAANIPRRHSGALWASVFAIGYGTLVVPGAIRDGQFLYALENVTMVSIIGLLGDWFIRVDRRALALSEALAAAPAGAEKLAIRNGLKRALGQMEISLDVLLAASNAGLTVAQAELLAYLTLGLTNQEIADATKVSEPTVRYRLTRLYRALAVRDRKGARGRARELGLASSLAGRAAPLN